MAGLTNYVYENNGTLSQPVAHSLKQGQQPLVYNVNADATSDAFPFSAELNTYRNIFICAESWGDAVVSLECSLDGVNCWTPVLEELGNTPISNINTNLNIPIVVRDCYLRAVVTTTTGVNVSAVLC